LDTPASKRGYILAEVGSSGLLPGSEGLRQRRAAGEKFGKQTLVPMFFLKGSVTVRRRVIPAVLQAWGNQLLKQALVNGKLLQP